MEEAFVRKVRPCGNVGLLGVSSRMSIASFQIAKDLLR